MSNEEDKAPRAPLGDEDRLLRSDPDKEDKLAKRPKEIPPKTSSKKSSPSPSPSDPSNQTLEDDYTETEIAEPGPTLGETDSVIVTEVTTPVDASNDALTVSSPNTADSTIAGVVNDSNPLTGHFTLPDEYISELAIFPYDFSSFNEHAVISLMSEFNSAIYSLLHDQSCPNNQRSTLSDMNDELTNAFMSAPTVAFFESLSPRLNRIRKYMLVPAFIRRDKALKQTPAPSSSTVGTSSLSATCFNPPALPTGPIPMVPYASSEKYQVSKPSNCIIRDCKFNAPSVTGADAHTLSQLAKILQPDITKTEATQFVTLLSAFHEASNVYSSDKYFDWTQTFIGAAAPFLPTIAERGAKDLTEAFFPESSSNHCIAAPLNPQEFAFQISSIQQLHMFASLHRSAHWMQPLVNNMWTRQRWKLMNISQ